MAAACTSSAAGAGGFSIAGDDRGTRRDGWRERFAMRLALREQQKVEVASLDRRREEERLRRELEERRRAEAAEKAAQQRREAAEFAAWRQDVILARRAEERARAKDHIQWRDRVTKVREGLPVHLPYQERVAAITCPVGAALGFLAPAVTSDAASSPRFDQSSESPIGLTPKSFTGDLGDDAARRLSEEDAWSTQVARNRAAIAAERAHREGEIAERARSLILAKAGQMKMH
eukprot:TRINITY_DN39820_c0_g1_i1.p1 TRINITY_DN39820_c0_g1~~TRINITY_DN39820_c0_g1_i1.p1  ORF type:complete len:251 (-),score=62.05 TRINITY_DN39820_c0_g1_i1:34-732(-)